MLYQHDYQVPVDRKNKISKRQHWIYNYTHEYCVCFLTNVVDEWLATQFMHACMWSPTCASRTWVYSLTKPTAGRLTSAWCWRSPGVIWFAARCSKCVPGNYTGTGPPNSKLWIYSYRYLYVYTWILIPSLNCPRRTPVMRVRFHEWVYAHTV